MWVLEKVPVEKIDYDVENKTLVINEENWRAIMFHVQESFREKVVAALEWESMSFSFVMWRENIITHVWERN